MFFLLRATALCIVASGIGSAAWAATSIDISAGYNSSFTSSYSGYEVLPRAGSTVSINNVNFQIGGTGPASFVGTTNGNPSVVSFSFAPVAVTDTIYTLMNNIGGNSYLSQNVLGYPNNSGSIGFLFSNGTTYSYTLRNGIDIRNYQGRASDAPDFGTGDSIAYGTARYGAASNYQFDAQKFRLPVEFQNQILTGIQLTDINPDTNGHDIGGAPFLLALDVSSADVASVPEPTSWAMTICGFGMIGGVLRRRSVKVAFA